MGSVKLLAKDIVRSRQYVSKFIEMRSHLQGVSLRLQTMKSHQAMAEAMKSTSQAMAKMNKAVNVQAVTKMLCEFDKENMKNEMMQEMMGDAIDGALNQEGNEEEEERIVSQVLDEIGVSLDSEIPTAPLGKKVGETTSIHIAKPGALDADPAVDHLEARLNNLKS
jgi:charged multivesicular body protein 2A